MKKKTLNGEIVAATFSSNLDKTHIIMFTMLWTLRIFMQYIAILKGIKVTLSLFDLICQCRYALSTVALVTAGPV
jgi:hypothetical protein